MSFMINNLLSLKDIESAAEATQKPVLEAAQQVDIVTSPRTVTPVFAFCESSDMSPVAGFNGHVTPGSSEQALPKSPVDEELLSNGSNHEEHKFKSILMTRDECTKDELLVLEGLEMLKRIIFKMTGPKQNLDKTNEKKKELMSQKCQTSPVSVRKRKSDSNGTANSEEPLVPSKHRRSERIRANPTEDIDHPVEQTRELRFSVNNQQYRLKNMPA